MNKITVAAVIGIFLMGAANADSIYARSVSTGNDCVRVYAVGAFGSRSMGAPWRSADLRREIRRDRLDGRGLSPAERPKIDTNTTGSVVRSIVRSTIIRHVRRRNYCKLYKKFNCKRMTLPRNSAGNGGNGFEALMPATAARSRASAPEGTAITSFGTVPSLLIAN